MISPAAVANTVSRFNKMIALILPLLGQTPQDSGIRIQEAVQSTVAQAEQAKASTAIRDLLTSISVPIPEAELPNPIDVAMDLVKNAPVSKLQETRDHVIYRFTPNGSVPSELLSIAINKADSPEVTSATLYENCKRLDARTIQHGAPENLRYATELISAEGKEALFQAALRRIKQTHFA